MRKQLSKHLHSRPGVILIALACQVHEPDRRRGLGSDIAIPYPTSWLGVNTVNSGSGLRSLNRGLLHLDKISSKDQASVRADCQVLVHD